MIDNQGLLLGSPTAFKWDINASKNILGLLLNEYRGEERPLCFKPEKITVKPRKSDKREKA